MKTATNITTVLSGLTQGTHYSDVKRFNAATQTWESYASSQFTQFEPGKGYNIIGLTNASFNYGATQQTTTFAYDSTGARTKKQVTGGSTTVYLGKDYEVEGAVTSKHIFLGDRRISTKKSDGTLQFIHTDHINSSNVITDASGNQSALLEFDPYGSTVTHTGSANPKHKFTGQEEDSSTRLYYYGARYYDPQLGRFITADPTVQHPTDPQDFNRYAYARNNPIRFTDPTGLGWLSKLFAVIFAIATLPFTAGQSGWIIVGVAALGGAAGGLAGAAIEKSNLAKGALQGAAIGAAVGATAAALGAGGGGAGGGGSASSVQITTSTTGIESSTVINITGVAEAIGTTGASAKGTIVLWNAIGSGVAWAATDSASGFPNKENSNASQSEKSSFAKRYPTSVYYGPSAITGQFLHDKKALEDIFGKFYKQPGHNEIRDAYRHAAASKAATESTDELTTALAGWYYEITHFFQPRSMPAWEYVQESRMDLHNNREGRMAARAGRDIKRENLVGDPFNNTKGNY